ncbi:MAG: hypothetical protein JJT76_00955 [Clostridiaceae bacterium]|nr:hypothetical protein [Clostridiaceae bacterium]
MEKKIIDINEYIERKKINKDYRYLHYKSRKKYSEDEERKKTFNLFMKVLATMEKESY